MQFQRHTLDGQHYTTHPDGSGYLLVDGNGNECASVHLSPCEEYWQFADHAAPNTNEVFDNRAYLNLHVNAPNVAPDLIEGALVEFYAGCAA